MILHEKVWKYKAKSNLEISSDLYDMEISNISKALLIKRNVKTKEDARKFLYPDVTDFYDPFTLDGMKKSVERINYAIEKKQKIWIFGDYDVDGITSTSLLIKTFMYMGCEVQFYIPDRKKEGYGINNSALKYIKDNGADLLITVDCGITSVNEAIYASDINLDLIITDHHECQETLPSAFAVINPKKESCNYKFDMLAGVGIALKLAHALIGEEFFNLIDELIDLAALGTIADIAPLNDENRIISKLGLEAINAYTSIGISALIEECGLAEKEINSGHIGFMIAPKINAAGRIGSPSLAVELLTTQSEERAKEIAVELCGLNDKRQDIEKQILKEAIEYVENKIDFEKEKIIVVEGKNWHTGIIGIVSSRISEKYYRPSIILNIEDGVAKGSARSVGNFSIFDALSSCKDLFDKFGGHDQAAGLSLDASKCAELRTRINQYASMNISEFDLIPLVNIEEELKSSDITYKLIDELSLFEPYGVGNSKPVFSYQGLFVDQMRLLGKDKEHLKLSVHDKSRMFDCLGFGMGEKFSYFKTNDLVNMAFTLEKNNFRGVETIQFMIKDIKSSHISDVKTLELKDTYINELFNYIDLIDNLDKDDLHFSNDQLLSEIDFKELIESDQRINIYVNTIDGIKDFYLKYFDKIINDVSYRWNFDTIEKINSRIKVLFLSDIFEEESLNILYDDFLSYDKIKLCNFENIKFYNYTNEKSITKEIIRSCVPDRDDLKNLYIFIKQNPAKDFILKEVMIKTNLNNLRLLLSLSLMIKEGLIKGRFDKVAMNVELIPSVEKINILETDYYKKIKGFKESYFELISLKNDLY